MAEVKIKIKANLDQLEKDLKVAEQELANHKNSYDKITEQIKVYNAEISESEKEIDKINEKIEKWKSLQQKVSSGTANVEQLAEFKSNPKLGNVLIKERDRLIESQIKLNEQIENGNSKLEKTNIQIEKAKNKVDKINMKRVANDTKLAQVNMNSLVGKTESVIRKVGKWALAVFSVRSAYALVRQASSTLSQYNKQYATDLEYIRYALAQGLAPILQWITKLAMTLLQYVYSILDAWFGISKYTDVSAKGFNKMKNSAAATAKSAKEINKNLASFDEMEILNNNSSKTDSGAIAPRMDLSGIQGDEPSWLRWIKGNKGAVLEFFEIIGTTIAGIKIFRLAEGFGLFGDNLARVDKIAKTSGIILVLYGIVKGIQDIISYVENPAWDNFGSIIKDIGLILGGLALIIGSIPLAIVAAIVVVLGIMAMFWDKIKEFGDNLVNGMGDVQNNLINKLGVFGVFLASFIEIPKQCVQSLLNIFDGLFVGVRQILDGIIMIFKGDFKNGLTTVVKGIANIVIGLINGLISKINLILAPARGLIVALGKVTGKSWTFDNVKIPTIPLLATGAIINNPGKGVPVAGGRAIGGEAGAEGIIPLTDSQAMETLGETIGRYVTINANITNSMNGRIISKILKEIQAEQDFAYNL